MLCYLKCVLVEFNLHFVAELIIYQRPGVDQEKLLLHQTYSIYWASGISMVYKLQAPNFFSYLKHGLGLFHKCVFRWLNDNQLTHFPHPALSQDSFSSLVYL